MKKTAIRGVVWTFTEYGFRNVLRLASNLILTRLLVPEMFGIMSLVFTFIFGLQRFSEIGISASIIQNPRGDEPEFLDTAWTIQIMRGATLWIGCLLIAWPVAQVYDEKQLLWLMPAVGCTSFIEGFTSTSMITLKRNLSFEKLTILGIGTQFISIIIMVGWALFSPTVWALVAGNIASGLIKTGWSHRLIPNYRNHLRWNKSVSDELFSFGKWIYISTVMTFLAGQSDKLILGKLFTLEMFGIYSIAFQMSLIPRGVVENVLANVMFPTISKLKSLPRPDLRKAISRKRLHILLGLSLLLSGLICFGDLIILFLYDDRYADASWMLVILSCGLWYRILTTTSNPILMAIGKPNYEAIGNIVKAIYIIVCLPFGYKLKGPLGALIVIACYDIPSYFILNYGLRREGLLYLRQDFMASILLIVFITILCTGRILLNLGLPLGGIV